MQAVQGLWKIAAAAALWGVLTLVRRRARGEGGSALQRQLGQDLQAPRNLLALYVGSAIGLLLLPADRVDWRHAFTFLSHLAAAVALLRIADAALFALWRTRGQQSPPRIVRSLVVWVLTFLVAAVVTKTEYQVELGSFLASGALLSVVLGFALQEPLGNLFAGLTLNAEHPFEAGDWVTFGKYTGRVLDVGWRSTRLLTLDEDELLVPNNLLSREVVLNHSRPALEDCVELTLRLDLDTPPARAKAVLLEVLGSVELVLAEPPPEVQVAAFAEDGVDYRLRFHTRDFGQERAVLDRVHEALWYGLRRAGMDLPFKQLTVSTRERASEATARRHQEHLAEAEDLLSRIDFVEALRPESRQLLAQSARFLEYGPGEAVVRQGEAGDTFFLVARGELAVRVKVDGGDKEVALLQRGAYFGEMSALTGDPRTATVVARTDAALLAVDRDAFSRLFAQDPGVMRELAQVIAGRKAQLASLRAEGVPQAVLEAEADGLLARIRGIFSFKRAG